MRRPSHCEIHCLVRESPELMLHKGGLLHEEEDEGDGC